MSSDAGTGAESSASAGNMSAEDQMRNEIARLTGTFMIPCIPKFLINSFSYILHHITTPPLNLGFSHRFFFDVSCK